MNKKIIFFTLILFTSLLFGSLVQTKIEEINDIKYISLNQFAKNHNIDESFYPEKNKFWINYYGNKIIFSENCSFVKFNDKIFQIKRPIIFKNKTYYISLASFEILLNSSSLPNGQIDLQRGFLITSKPDFNIHSISINSKSNGSKLSVATTQKFDDNSISASINRSGWMNITIPGGVVDSMNIVNSKLNAPVSQIKCMQFYAENITLNGDTTYIPKSAQISFFLKSKIDDYDIYQNKEGTEIQISLRTNIAVNAEKIKKSRSKWLFDSVVIDPGHGGKDKGAIGPSNIYEKDVNLAICKKLGKLIEEKMGVRVIYTREEDDFIPLWKRTKIANESGGKIFISIHANASPKSKNAKGFETYLLRPGKSQDAMEVALRENEVIKMEKDERKYKNFSDPQNLILATMAQNEFLKESEVLADLIQKSLDKKLTSPNRGVKQAGFYVLVGASMPNVLVETGFLSNKQEAKMLAKSSYQKKIAEGIFEALLDFKNKYETSFTMTN